MASDTKKQKGRPKKFDTSLYALFNDKEARAAQNTYYASLAIHELLDERPGGFFVTCRGNIRRQGIAEQLGRLYDTGVIDKEQGRELAQTVMEEYNNGATAKEIETKLRTFRRSLQEATE